VALETNQRLWQEGAVDPGLYADVLALLEEFRESTPAAAGNEG
jgi:hypothetical protein